jgi:hypothetical protein
MTFQQQKTLGNAASTVCHPIDWAEILKQTEKIFTPKTVRAYLVSVVDKMNKHFAIWMDGPKMGKIRITRRPRHGTTPVVVSVSVWRARQLFPHMLQVRWLLESGIQKTLFRNVINLWSCSRNRKEIYQEIPRQTSPLCHSPVIEWLKLQLALPEELCEIKWGGLNVRRTLYESFLETIKYPEDWTPKKISQEFYRTLPACRPATGVRVRRNGVACMHMPSRESCNTLLEHWAQKYESSDELRF